MSALNRKMFIIGKSTVVLIVLITAALIFTITTFVFTGNHKVQNKSLQDQITELQTLSENVISLKSEVDSKEKRIRSSRTKGAVSALEQILKALGLKAAAIKPLEKKKINDFMEEKAELEIQDTDLNRIVNLLYKIDNAPSPMKINSASIKTTFEDPDKFVLKLSVSLLSK